MRYANTQSFQSGVALILSLLILLVLTVVGVAAMNSTIMQERMAGNAKTQADSFEKSSEGVSRALELFYEEADDLAVLDDPKNSNDIACGQLFEQYDSFDPASAEAWSHPSGGTWHLASGDGENPKLEQKMYCCESWVEVDIVDESGSTTQECVENPSKLFVLNRATFVGSDGNDGQRSLSTREIEVELAESEPDDPTCAICVPGDVGSVSGPTSAGKGSFRVSGSCGAAVVAQGSTNAGRFKGGIDDNVIGKFEGGVQGAENMGLPWNSPTALAEFVFWVKLGLGTDVPGAYIDKDSHAADFNGDTYEDSGNTEYGESDNDGNIIDPQITYIDGNADFGGNISGAGIMIVRGTLKWAGTPNFNGLLISLGGGFDVGGGGGGGNPAGSMVITELVSSNARDLFGREVLHYEVARDNDAQEVVIYYPDDFEGGQQVRRAQPGGGIAGSEISERHVPVRPVLRADDGTRLIHYFDPDLADHRFFYYEAGSGHAKGEEYDDPITLDAGNFEFWDASGSLVMTVSQSITPTRDAYGRMIPDFVQTDNYPDDYGFNPNEWSWDESLAGAYLDWGSSDFDWKGGGKQNFTYDCQTLQRVKQDLLCTQRIKDLPAGSDDFYKDPEPQLGEYCWHAKEGQEGESSGGDSGKYFYESDSRPEDPRLPENQKAWHMWNPSCDCLGISVETDMVISGWRENLGWRDDEGFQGCQGLATKNACN